MLVFILSLVLITPSYAEDEIIPEYASKQALITAKTLEYEDIQFRSIADWKSARAQIEGMKVIQEQAELEWERVKKLVDSGQKSESDLMRIQVRLQEIKENINYYIGQSYKSKAKALVNKYRLLEEGNPGTDHRGEIADSMMDSLINERENAEKRLESARSYRDYFEDRWKKGKILLDKKIITQSEYESRFADFNHAKERVVSLEEEVKGIKNSIHGLELSKQKLTG